MSGTVTGIAAGATFQIAVTDGALTKTYTATVNAAGTGWTATIPEADAVTLSNGKATITAQVADAYGNESAQATDKVTVAETLPTVMINKINGYNLINNETRGCGVYDGKGEGPKTVRLTGSVTGIAAKSTFVVTVTDSSFKKSYTATVNAAGNGWTATIPQADVAILPDGKATVATTVVDVYGNVSPPATQSVTVEGTTPTVLSVTASPANGDFGVGKTIAITLNMNEAVSVCGCPTLTLNDCGVATFSSGQSTSTALVFDYTIRAGQNTSDLKVTDVALGRGASIDDASGSPANLSGAAANIGIVVDTKPYQVKTVNADGSHDIAYFNVAGQSYTSDEVIYNGSGVKVAFASDNANGKGLLTLYANGGAVTAGPGALNVTAGADTFAVNDHASETITATGTKSDTFIFAPASGQGQTAWQDVISGFAATGSAHDQLRFNASAFGKGLTSANQSADLAALLSHTVNNSAGSAVITDIHGDSLTLIGIGKTALSAAANTADFRFV